jgi:hypothetical protein
LRKEMTMSSRIYAHWLLVAIVCVAMPAWAAGPATDTSFGTDDVSIVVEGEFARVSLPECGTLSEAGEPELPAQVLRFVIPGDMRVSDVVLSHLSEQELPGVHRVMPAQKQVPTGEEAVWTEPRAAIYESDQLFPASRVEYLGDGYLGGYHIASVAVYPMQYAPQSGRLILATDISVELELAPAADRSAPRSRMTSDSAELYRSVVEGLVENPWEVSGKLTGVSLDDGIGDEGFSPRYSPSLEGSAVE